MANTVAVLSTLPMFTVTALLAAVPTVHSSQVLPTLLETHPDLRGDITHVYFENVVNPKLIPLYKEFGAQLALDEWPQSYYLKLNLEQSHDTSNT